MTLTGFRWVALYTDVVLWLLAFIVAIYVLHVLRTPQLKRKWSAIGAKRTALLSLSILSVFFAVALLDSVHWRAALPEVAGQPRAYATQTVSLLDTFVGERIAARERSYSAPFAIREFDKTTRIVNGKPIRDFQRLRCARLDVTDSNHVRTVCIDLLHAIGCGVSAVLTVMLFAWGVRRCRHLPHRKPSAFASVWLTVLFLAVLLTVLWPSWHVLGTDTTGNDVLYVTLKSIRTALVIGSLATFSMLPFAILLGIAAGYFKGWVDDVIQYVYTTLSSIPSVLLIAASVLMIQVFIDRNPLLFETGLERADLRLFLLATIIGVTGWSGLARLLRAESMKVASLDFVNAAKAFGVSPFTIMVRHILPNVAHIVLIVAVLDFSGIVLYEAVLSYVGIGVDPTMQSFGSMINAAASEMSRTPAVWWNLLSCFLCMGTLVLSMNLFASGVREVFDPRTGDGGRDA